jgi:tetratricopeptide (TPR) repeat protein
VSLDRWCYPRGLIDPPGAVEFRWGAPLRLYERGMWIAGDEYWGEPEGVVPVPLVEVIAGGARRGYEFEQLLPGGDDPDARDVIVEALALRDGGQQERAEAVLRGVAEWDPRCLDAHAHLGLLAFDAGDVEAALAHYAAGVWVAEQSLPEDFDGVLSWGWVDNRPFLRCLHGLMISAWRLGDLERGETLCWALLWLNPGDHLGASDLLAKLIAGEPWHP